MRCPPVIADRGAKRIFPNSNVAEIPVSIVLRLAFMLPVCIVIAVPGETPG